jgi:Domain of unknown function (DUF4160)
LRLPTISYFYGIYIRMYVREHSPPHFHAVYGEFEANVSISAGEVIEGRLPPNAAASSKNGARDIAPNWSQTGVALRPDRPLKG